MAQKGSGLQGYLDGLLIQADTQEVSLLPIYMHLKPHLLFQEENATAVSSLPLYYFYTAAWLFT